MSGRRPPSMLLGATKRKAIGRFATLGDSASATPFSGRRGLFGSVHRREARRLGLAGSDVCFRLPRRRGATKHPPSRRWPRCGRPSRCPARTGYSTGLAKTQSPSPLRHTSWGKNPPFGEWPNGRVGEQGARRGAGPPPASAGGLTSGAAAAAAPRRVAAAAARAARRGAPRGAAWDPPARGGPRPAPCTSHSPPARHPPRLLIGLSGRFSVAPDHRAPRPPAARLRYRRV